MYVATVTNDDRSVVEESLERFLSLAKEMLSKDEYLFPYLWAQRQYREDQYQMASAAQLEDLFFDTLGAYVRQNVPGETFDRRQGREPWDYDFAGIALSHKEGVKPGITAVWQPGEGPGNKNRLYETWNFEHPVVFVYTPKTVTCSWSGSIPRLDGTAIERVGTCWPLSHGALNLSSAGDSTTFLGKLEGTRLTVSRAWRTDDWRRLSVHELRESLGQPRPENVDFWIDKTTRNGGLAGIPLSNVQFPFDIELTHEPLLPGLYLLLPEELRAQHLESNNKAHFLPQKAMIPCMESARAAGRFIQLPLWPMEFADVTPPNLYAQQRRRYDDFMSARGSLH